MYLAGTPTLCKFQFIPVVALSLSKTYQMMDEINTIEIQVHHLLMNSGKKNLHSLPETVFFKKNCLPPPVCFLRNRPS